MGKLHQNERELLYAALKDSFTTIENFNRLAARFQYIPDNIRPSQAVSSRLEGLVDQIDNDRDPAKLELLFTIPDVITDWQDKVGLRAALNQVRQTYQDRLRVTPANLANDDPFNACLLSMGRPFIDREDFRNHLRDISNEAGSRYMVVNGPSGIGKSYTYYLMQSLAPRCGFKLVYAEIKPGERARYHGIDLAREIKRQLLLPDPERILEQQASVDERWTGELAGWLQESIQAIGRQVWIVLDGFDYSDLPSDPRHDLPSDTHSLVANLIEAVDITLINVRLILLDYDRGNLPPSVRFFAHEENLEEVTQKNLEDFLDKVCRYKNIRPSPVKINAVVAQLLGCLQQTPQSKRMETIMAGIFNGIKSLDALSM